MSAENMGWRKRVSKSLICSLVFCLIAVVLVIDGGCKKPNSGAVGETSSAQDPFQIAISGLEDSSQARFIEASRPILEAIARRDYDRLFAISSKYALQTVSSHQFAPELNDAGVAVNESKTNNMTKEQFLDGMKQMESTLGLPHRVLNVCVQTSDPKELSGQADEIDNMFNLGAMPKEIPIHIRRASIRAQLEVRVPEDRVKATAEQLGVSEDDIRSGKAWEDTEPPFLTAKIVLVEDDGLKMGYFEFQPRNIFD
jgi:hypothetical protein